MPEKTNLTGKNIKVEEARKHFKAAHESMHESLVELLPKGFIEHHKAARREILLAMRSLLDAAIEHMDKKIS